MVATHQIETTGTRWCDGNHKAKHSPSLPPPSFPATFPSLAEGAQYKSCSSSEEMSVGVDLAVVSWFGKGCHQILAQNFWGPCLGKDCREVQETCCQVTVGTLSNALAPKGQTVPRWRRHPRSKVPRFWNRVRNRELEWGWCRWIRNCG